MGNKNAIPPKDKQFKPGQSGNPKGRPKKLPELDELMREVMGTETKKGITEMQEVIIALKDRAKKGDVRAAEVLLNRGYGQAKAVVDITSKGEKIGPGIDLSTLSEQTLRELADKLDKNTGDTPSGVIG